MTAAALLSNAPETSTIQAVNETPQKAMRLESTRGKVLRNVNASE